MCLGKLIKLTIDVCCTGQQTIGLSWPVGSLQIIESDESFSFFTLNKCLLILRGSGTTPQDPCAVGNPGCLSLELLWDQVADGRKISEDLCELASPHLYIPTVAIQRIFIDLLNYLLNLSKQINKCPNTMRKNN